MTQIGPYRVVDELARGGMGVVYRAQAPNGLAVAIKLLLAHRASNARARERFQVEARTLARLRHPNVVSIVDVGEHEGAPWIALEFVLGQSLEQRLRTGPLPIGESVQIARDLAKALSYVHTCDVLHRDIKPGNVLLSADGARLTDFGIAKDPSSSSRQLTATGVFLGTPGYWPPEQARGQHTQLGPRSDLYGLGAVLYACLTGEPPVSAPSLQAYLLDEVNYRTITPPRAVRPEVPAWLDALCMRCLAPDPQHRPRSAGEVEQTLLHAGAQKASSSPTPLLIGGSVAALGLALGLAAWAYPRAGAAPATVTPPEATGQTPARPSAAKLIAQARELRDAERYTNALALLDEAAELAPEAATVYAYRGEVYMRRGNLAEALADLDRALELDPTQSRIWYRRGSVHEKLHNHEEGIHDFSEAIRLDPEYLEAWHARADLGQHMGRDPKLVLIDYGRALELDPNDAQIYLDRARAYTRQQRYEEALADLDRAIELVPNDHRLYTNRGGAKRDLKRFDEALADLDHAERLEPNDPFQHLNRGICYYELGQLPRALSSLERAVDLAPENATALFYRGSVRGHLGRHDEALRDFGAALRIRPKYAAAHYARGRTHAELDQFAEAIRNYDTLLRLESNHADGLFYRGNAKAALGQREAAIEDFSEAIRAQPTHAGAHCNRGLQRKRLGDQAGALADYSRAIELGPNDFEPRLNRGNLLAEQGRTDEAIADYRALLDDYTKVPDSARARAEERLQELGSAE